MATIRRLLNRVRAQETTLDLSWALARWLSLAVAAFVLACGVDWLVDRRMDTPDALRVGLLLVQSLVWLAALVRILRPLVRRWSDDRVALWIEERVPDLGHRLISAVQLNRPGAQTQGMSPDLIAAVTRQAEERAGRIEASKLSDRRRFHWSAALFGPVAIAFAVLVLLAPETWAALAARVFLADRDIPRSLSLTALVPEVWPAGEEGLLLFQVSGQVPPADVIGEVLLEPDEGPPVRLALRPGGYLPELYSARVPPSDVPFHYRAWLGDARLRVPGVVRYEPRPVVQSIQAWVQLPESLIGKRPGGSPFEEAQRGGDVGFRLPGSRARLLITTQVPVVGGEVRILGKQPRTIPLPAELRAEFDLLPDDQAYRVVVRDRHGFENSDPPQRAIKQLPLEPPEVTLLPETFWKPGDAGPPEDREVEGIPVLEGKSFRLDYRCSDRYGLSHVLLRYRVVPRSSKPEEESGPIDRDKFLPLPLGPVRGKPDSARAREEFSTRPPSSPDDLPDTGGGGRCDFNTTGIPDGKGGRTQLQQGDRIQFFVEVYSKAQPDGPPGRSAVREKEVVGLQEYLAWLEKKEDLKERTRYLEQQQRGVRAPGP